MRAVVPPNTVAHVRLPGRADEFDVTAGSHEWTAPFEPPAPLALTPTWGGLAIPAKA